MSTIFRLNNAALPALAALSFVAAPLSAPVHAQAADEAKLAGDPQGEAELAKLLEGRTMGEPKSCLTDNQRRNMQIIDHTAFVFRDGDTIYVNRPNGASFLDDFDLPVFRIFGSSLCRLDQVELRDRSSRIGGPIVSLNDFVPYTLEKEPKV